MSNPSPFHWQAKAGMVIAFIILLLELKPLVKGLAVLAANVLILVVLVAGIYWILKGGLGAFRAGKSQAAPLAPTDSAKSVREMREEVEQELAEIKRHLRT